MCIALGTFSHLTPSGGIGKRHLGNKHLNGVWKNEQALFGKGGGMGRSFMGREPYLHETPGSSAGIKRTT